MGAASTPALGWEKRALEMVVALVALAVLPGRR